MTQINKWWNNSKAKSEDSITVQRKNEEEEEELPVAVWEMIWRVQTDLCGDASVQLKQRTRSEGPT